MATFRDKTSKPTVTAPNFDGVPKELRPLPQWVLWKFDWANATSQWAKVPYATNGARARSNSPDTWSTFEEVKLAFSPKLHAGIGFVFTADDDFCGVDFDNCIENGNTTSDVVKWIARLESYTEISASGTGVHVIIKAKPPKCTKRGNIEVYDRLRYFAFTGDQWSDDAELKLIVNRQREIEELLTSITPSEPVPAKAQTVTPARSVQELLQIAFNASNGGSIQALYGGDKSAYGDDDSSADMALCAKLAYYCDRDPAILDSMFRGSQLYRRKWDVRHHGDGRTYGQMTVDRAISLCTNFYSDKNALPTAQRNEPPTTGIYRVRDLREKVHELYRTGRTPGASPGWDSLAKLYTVKKGLFTVLSGVPGSGKALALDTPIPTINGWTTMGEVEAGDMVFAEDGRPCEVTRVTDIMIGRPCFEIVFSDGSVLIADAEHQWLTRSDKARRSLYVAKKRNRLTPRALAPKGTDQSHLRTYPSVVSTREISETLYAEKGHRLNHAVKLASAIQLPNRKLPIDPYVLGVWLGDGNSRDGRFASNDVSIVDEISAAGYSVHKNATKYEYQILGIKPSLRELDLLANKHIPKSYLRASKSQRLALLQGLMDTDGCISPKSKRCEFTSTNRQLADGVFELMASLGLRPTFKIGTASLYGKNCGDKYRICFTTNQQVFRLLRKAQYIPITIRSDYRYVLSCRQVPSVPVRCIEVNSPSHLYLCGRSFIPTHNSAFLDAMLINLAQSENWKFAVCSVENQPLQDHISCLTEIYLGKPFNAGHTPRMTRSELDQALDWLDEHFTMVLPDEQSRTLEGIISRVAEMDIDGVVIDPWNELEHRRPPNMSETEYVSVALSRMRQHARLFNQHWWLVAHPTKLQKDKNTGKYGIPTLYDISGSANFRNKADFGLIAWRDFEHEAGPTAIYVQKVRFRWCGEIGSCELYFDKLTGRYSERPNIYKLPERKYVP